MRAHRLGATALALLVASAALAPVPRGRAQEFGPRGRAQEFEQPRLAHTDAELLEAWSGLGHDDRTEIVEWLGAELRATRTLQLDLVRFLVDASDVDKGLWPRAEPPPMYDPVEHAPGQVISRRPLPLDGDVALRERARLLADVPERRLDPAWSYDWSSGQVVSLKEDRDPDRLFRNALRGFPPDLDYAEALLERALDDGSQRAVLAAFAHAYTDRNGRVYPGLTLYDAWASGELIEMPDVDTLGIVHDVLGDEKTWVAPVPPSQHDELYGKLGELFVEAHRHRGLRTALARAYLSGTPVLRDGYADSLNRLHAIWDEVESDPARALSSLPHQGEWTEYLEGWAKKYQRKADVRESSLRRRHVLEAGSAVVRETLVRVLDEYGALKAPELPTGRVSAAGESGAGSGPVKRVPVPPLTAAVEQHVQDAVAALSSSRRTALVRSCVEAALATDAPQVDSVRALIEGAGGVARKLPEATPSLPHDAKLFLGGPPRKLRGPKTSEWRTVQAALLTEPEPEWTRAVDYELGTGRVVELPIEGAADARTLQNLLRGYLPDQDYAEALLLAAFDPGGKLRLEAEFFSHTYADRDGNAFEGITLYDAWSSPILLEVPDVDARAYAHKVWNDHSIPVLLSKGDQKLWYPRMGDSLARVRLAQRLSRSLAATWLRARPVLPLGYDPSTDILHASIALEGGDPARVAARLARDGEAYLQRALEELRGMGNEGWNAGNARRDALSDGEAAIRAAVFAVLREKGLLDS